MAVADPWWPSPVMNNKTAQSMQESVNTFSSLITKCSIMVIMAANGDEAFSTVAFRGLNTPSISIL
jgi:hypothetical protein